MITYLDGKKNLESLIEKFSEQTLKNEAETRFHFIDEFLITCLGWDRETIHVENYESGEYTDYELGKPRSLILEAKREDATFELPVDPQRKFIQPLCSIMDLCRMAKSAIEQVQGYCAKRGVRYAVISNGPQLIAFIAVRLDGKSPFDGMAFVIDSFSQLKLRFMDIYQYLSPAGIEAHKLLSILEANGIGGIPDKLSTLLPNYRSYRYQNDSQLRMVAELLLEDVPRTSEVESRFYKECYCESGPLAQDALISKSLLKARYAALFNPTEASPSLSPVRGKHNNISSEILAEGLSRRPIVLIGDVGVGKTSFIRNLILIQATEEFKNSIYIYLDLGVNSFLESDLEAYIYKEIDRQLREDYSIDINEKSFIYSVYKDEIQRFENGIYGSLKDSNKIQFDLKLLEMLEEKISSKEEHLKSIFMRISKSHKKQIIIILDNIDQRDLDIQQKAFIISQSIAQHWHAIVFLAVRPNTFHSSKRSGALSAYPNKVFYIMPPRPELVLEKRLIFALNMAEGRMPLESIQSVSINLTDIALFIKALLRSVRKKELAEFLSNITGGNVRSMIDFVTKFIGSPNVDSDKIIELTAKEEYIIPLHEFSKSALLGDYSHYDSTSSLAMNIFDIRFPDKREHFLCLFILGYLNYDASHRNHEGFVSTINIEEQMQSIGYSQEQTESALRRLTNKKLIETTQRFTFEESSGTDLQGDMPEAFRITTIGAYHLSRWCGTFEYLDAMVFDTPMFEESFRDQCKKNLGSFDITVREHRTLRFKEYLNLVWASLGVNVPYFNWSTATLNGKLSFERVRAHINSLRK